MAVVQPARSRERTLWILYLCCILCHTSSRAFTQKPAFGTTIRFDMGLAAKRKESMSQKLARRSQRRRKQVDTDVLPPCQLDFKTTTTVTEPPPPSVDAPAAQTVAPEQTQAQKLLANQRDSVAMLTSVKNALDELDNEEIVNSLKETGCWYTDDFFKKAVFRESLNGEAAALHQSNMTTMDRVGEFQVPLTGGEQYAVSPRLVEWVVAMTQHVPAKLESHSVPLDNKKCMATLRTWDRKALLASLSLLTGEVVDEDTILESQSERAAERIVPNRDDDLRRLSMRYYLEDWKGGDLTLDGTVVAVKRDRLVMWLSDKTEICEQPWVGWADKPTASWIELHLLQA